MVGTSGYPCVTPLNPLNVRFGLGNIFFRDHRKKKVPISSGPNPFLSSNHGNTNLKCNPSPIFAYDPFNIHLIQYIVDIYELHS